MFSVFFETWKLGTHIPFCSTFYLILSSALVVFWIDSSSTYQNPLVLCVGFVPTAYALGTLDETEHGQTWHLKTSPKKIRKSLSAFFSVFSGRYPQTRLLSKRHRNSLALLFLLCVVTATSIYIYLSIHVPYSETQ
jgi:hypothetical protein